MINGRIDLFKECIVVCIRYLGYSSYNYNIYRMAYYVTLVNLHVFSLYPPLAFLHPSALSQICFKVRGPFVQILCIEKDSYMDAI